MSRHLPAPLKPDHSPATLNWSHSDSRLPPFCLLMIMSVIMHQLCICRCMHQLTVGTVLMLYHHLCR